MALEITATNWRARFNPFVARIVHLSAPPFPKKATPPYRSVMPTATMKCSLTQNRKSRAIRSLVSDKLLALADIDGSWWVGKYARLVQAVVVIGHSLE
jgi:hypothetical protein